MHQQVFRRVTVRLEEPITVDRVGTVTVLSEAEADAYLGDLLARIGRGDEARAKLEAIVDADPTVARAHAALGMLDLRQHRVANAVPRLRRPPVVTAIASSASGTDA